MKTLSIQITLPKDRRRPGVLKLYTDDQPEIFVAPCLGMGTGHPRLNPRRDQMKRWGDTPSGAYKPAVVIDRGFKQAGRPPYGRFIVPLLPVSAEVLRARSGLLIHGGRGNAKLMVTRGCIRLLDVDMARLAKHAAGAVLKVEIFDRIEAKDEKYEAIIAYVRGLTRDKKRRLFALLQQELK